MKDLEIFGVQITDVLPASTMASIIRAALLIVVGFPLVFFAGRWLRLYISKHFSAQQGMIAGKIVQYGGFLAIFFSLIHEFGFQLGPLLGAAGIVGIAVGFASQTSVSNIISGVFLIAEKPFVVGDAIKVGETTGQVLSIDFLSVKLRTFDNRFVRIPNETIIKSEVTNITYFPIRRFDLTIGVAYKEDIARVKQVLLDVAYKNPLALQEPEPLVIFNAFGSSSIDLLFVVWAETADWLTLKNSLPEEVKLRFDQEGIEIPFPHISLYTGSATAPMPVTVNGPAASAKK